VLRKGIPTEPCASGSRYHGLTRPCRRRDGVVGRRRGAAAAACAGDPRAPACTRGSRPEVAVGRKPSSNDRYRAHCATAGCGRENRLFTDLPSQREGCPSRSSLTPPCGTTAVGSSGTTPRLALGSSTKRHWTYRIEFKVSCMWRCPDTSTCSSLPSSGYRGRPLREPCGSPPSPVLWTRKTARLPLPAPPVALGRRRLRLRVVRFSRGQPSPPGDLVSLGWAPPGPACGEAGSSPGFTGNPLVSMPRASDSGDPGHASPSGVPDAAFRPAKGVGIAMRSISELNPHGLLTHCVRFAPASHPTNGNTRYRPARYGFDRTGLAPAGFQQEVSLTHRSSSSSALFPARSQYDPDPPLGAL